MQTYHSIDYESFEFRPVNIQLSPLILWVFFFYIKYFLLKLFFSLKKLYVHQCFACMYVYARIYRHHVGVWCICIHQESSEEGVGFPRLETCSSRWL